MALSLTDNQNRSHDECKDNSHHHNNGPPNPWNNKFNVNFDEPLLINPNTKQPESREHQNKRLEIEHLYSIVHSFNHYATWQFFRFQAKHFDYNCLPQKYKRIAPFLPDKFKKIRSAIIQNQSFISLITQQSISFISGSRGFNMNPDFIQIDYDQVPSAMNMDKVRSTLKQMARDWTSFGIDERKHCYSPILNKLVELFPNRSERPNVRVLNPGCGLGRLPWEIAKLGFFAQGNEFSYFMLMASHFVLNKCTKPSMYTIYPYADVTKNQWAFDNDTNDGQMAYCKVPDVSPSDLMRHIADLKRHDLLSMVAGDFCEIYSGKEHHGAWDVIASCFFLDTAHNILEYLDIFSKCLSLNGYLINLGPLLYHFEDGNDPSIEMSYDEIMRLLPVFGFKVVFETKRENAIKAGYAQSQHSMMQNYYDCAFWVAQKVKEVDIENYHNDAKENGHN